MSLTHVRHLFRLYGPMPALIWVGTFGTVIATDLLTGVLVGLGLSMIELVPHLRRLRLEVREHHEDAETRIALAGTATFVSLPRLCRVLEGVPEERPLRIDVSGVRAFDHTAAEMVVDWLERKRARGMSIDLIGRHAALGRLA